MADAGEAVAQPPLALIARIDGHAEEGNIVVVEHIAVGEHGIDCCFPLRIACGADKQHDDVAAPDRVEGVARMAGGTLMEPGRRVSRLQGHVAARGFGGLIHGCTHDCSQISRKYRSGSTQ